MALDEPLDDDTVIEQDGFSFCINKELLEETTGVSVDVSYMGFVIEPNKPFAAASNCSSGGCSSNCGSATN